MAQKLQQVMAVEKMEVSILILTEVVAFSQKKKDHDERKEWVLFQVLGDHITKGTAGDTSAGQPVSSATWKGI